MIYIDINKNTNNVSINNTYKNIELKPSYVNTKAKLTIFYTLKDDTSAESEYDEFLRWTHSDSTCLTLNSFKKLEFGCDTKPNQSVPSFDDFTHIIDEFDKKIETDSGKDGMIDFTSFGQINGHFIIEKHTNTTTDTLDANVPMEKALMDKAEQIHNIKSAKYQLDIKIETEDKLSYIIGNSGSNTVIHCKYMDNEGIIHTDEVYKYPQQSTN